MLIFDGECGFCAAAASWITPRLRIPISVVPRQDIGDLDELGLTEAELSGAVYWIDAYGRADRGHRAVGRALIMTSGPLVLAGWLLLLPPTSWLGAVGYGIVARLRGKLPGTSATTPA
jgi:predicted DCC family thiol-disulfide oxidoreductase YuxK